MKKIIFVVISIAVFGGLSGVQAQNGFVIWSKGGGCDRELHYNSITDGTKVGPEKLVIAKGEGADIWPHISYDGEWLAWCRSPKSFKGRWGGCDYHNFGVWDLYIGRIEFGNKLPVEPIKIANGYFPSWAMDENAKIPGRPKTLYFTKYDDQTVQKTIINPDGTFTPPVEHSKCPKKMSGSNAHTQGSPDGKFILYRPRELMLYSVEAQKDISGNLGGCHPCWGPRSKYFVRSKNTAYFNTGTSVKSLGKAGVGSYFQGLSNDAYWDEGRLWVIGRRDVKGMTNSQNAPGIVEFREVQISNDGKWEMDTAIQVGEGSAVDIHMFPKDFDPKNPTKTLHGNLNISNNGLAFTAQLITTGSGWRLIINSLDLSVKTAELFDLQGERVDFIRMSNSRVNIMPLNNIVNGRYILKVSGNDMITLESIFVSK